MGILGECLFSTISIRGNAESANVTHTLLSLPASRGSDFALKIKSQMLIIFFFMADFLRESCYYESVARGVGKSPSFISCEIFEGKKKNLFNLFPFIFFLSRGRILRGGGSV